MKAKIKKLWVKALRSGKYKQTTGRLQRSPTAADEGGFCCLGVLCELHRKASKKKGWSSDLSYQGRSDTLPSSVQTWAGLPDSDPTVANHALSHRNDQLHETFPQIADLIDAHL